MAANTSHAVRAQRHEPKDSLDFFGTRPWATRALVEHVLKPLDLFDPLNVVWEPACGQGHMARALMEYYAGVRASDIYNYGPTEAGPVRGFFQYDFLHEAHAGGVDWVITNPPFKHSLEFIHKALDRSGRGVAMYGPLTMLEGVARYNHIYRPYKGQFTIAPFVERCPTNKGAPKKNATTASAYAWLVICPGRVLTPLIHIPPCRADLERDGDYPPDTREVLP